MRMVFSIETDWRLGGRVDLPAMVYYRKMDGEGLALSLCAVTSSFWPP